MKKRFFLLFSLWGILLYAQPNLLPEVSVTDSLLPYLSIGHHVQQVELNHSNTDVGQQMAGKSSVVIKQAAPNLLAGYYLRGSYSDGVQVFWNGMPVNSPTLGSTDLNLLSPNSFDQILVLPGGSGAELGSGAVGGSIFFNNMLSKRSPSGQTLRLGVGANGYSSVSSKTVVRNTKSALSLNLFYDGAKNDYAFLDGIGKPRERTNNAYYRQGLNTGYVLDIGKVQLNSNLLVQEIYRQIPATSTGINPSFPAKAWQSDRVYRMQNVVQYKTWHFEQGFNIEQQVYSDETYDIYSLNNFNQYSSEIRKEFISTKKINWEGGAYLNAYTASGTNVNQQQNEYGLRTDFVHRVTNKLLYKVGLSTDFIDQRFAKQLDTTGSNFPLLPTLAAQYALSNTVLLRANVGEVFNNPTLNERFWPEAGVEDIQPERGYNAEIGLDYTTKFNRVKSSLHVTLYYLRLKNRIRWIQFSGALFRPQNVSESEAKGIDFQHELGYTKSAFSLEFNYNVTYNSAIVLKDAALGASSEGMQLINMPLLIGGAQLQSSYSKVSFYLSTQFNSGAYTTSDNDPLFKVEPFWIGNIGGSYRFSFNKFVVIPELSVLNFTDVAYQILNFQPMPGAQLYINVIFNYSI